MKKITVEVTQVGDKDISVASEGKIVVKCGNESLIKVKNGEHISSIALVSTLLDSLNYNDVKYHVGSRYKDGYHYIYADLIFKSGEKYRVLYEDIKDNPKEVNITSGWNLINISKFFKEHIDYVKKVEDAIIEHSSTTKITVLSF